MGESICLLVALSFSNFRPKKCPALLEHEGDKTFVFIDACTFSNFRPKKSPALLEHAGTDKKCEFNSVFLAF